MSDTTTTPRCGHMTSTGPCARPEGHPKTGHRSKDALANRGSRTTLTVEEMATKEAERAKAAKERIKVAKAAQTKRIERLRTEAKALGFELVPIDQPTEEVAATE